jgi:hypothetical protein
VRSEVALFLSVNGEGFGWRLEESNRNIKMAMTGDSADQFDFAAAARDMMVAVRANLFSELGLTDTEARERTLQDLSLDVRKCEQVLCRKLDGDKRLLEPRAMGREFFDLLGERLLVDSMDAIVAKGQAALDVAAEALRSGAHRRNWPFPKLAEAVAISSDEKKEGVTRADGRSARAAAAIQELEAANLEVAKLRAELATALKEGDAAAQPQPLAPTPTSGTGAQE